MPASKKHSPERPQTGSGIRKTGSSGPWLVFGGAALVALLVYVPTLQYGFVWDDAHLILNNPYLARTNPIEIFTREFWHNPEIETEEDDNAYYRPLSNLSLYVDHKVWGLRPTGYHLTNVIINAAVVFLMCLLLWELFGSVWLAGLGGLLVGIHPAMNCVVAFISNRTYLLALFFLLICAYALARGRRGRGRIWPVLFGGSFLLSALAVEASLVFAVIATLWLLSNRSRYGKPRSLPRDGHPHPSLPLKGEGTEGRGSSVALLTRKSVMVWMAAIASPLAVYFLLRFGVARVPFTGTVMYRAIADPLRIINAFGQQLQLLLFPFNQKVIYVLAKPFTSFSAYTILGLLLLGLPLYAVIRVGRSTAGLRDTKSSNLKPRLSARPELEAGRLGWLGYVWMVLFVLPFAHLVVLGPAGRILYMAAPGVLILLAALFRTSVRKRPTARAAYALILLCTAVFGVQTLRRNPIWRDELSLAQTMVLEAPESPGGHLNYASALSNAGRKDEAIAQYRIAVRINPDYLAPRFGLAFALIDRGDLPGGIRELREVVRLQPSSPRARNDLAVTLSHNGQLDSAIVEYKEALRLDPNSELTLNNLGIAYMTRGDFQQAIAVMKAALQLKPDYADARRSLADAYRRAGMPDSAALVESGKP